MKFLYHILFSAALIFALPACKNDLKLNAPYKEIPSIYAVLNAQDKMQIIRINKVFLGESDANAMAQVTDSINYPEGQLTVTLKRFVNNIQSDATPGQQVITFRDSVIQAQPGIFNTTQRVYVTSAPLYTYGDYVLTVYNNHTKNTFTAKATALDSVKPLYRPFTGLYYPVPVNPANVNGDNYIDYSAPASNYTIRYKPNEAKMYQLLMRIHYYDSLLEPPANGYKNFTYADYAFTNQYSKDVNTQGDLINTFKGQNIYDAIGTALAKLPANSNLIGRRTYKAQFFIFSSTQEYSDYLQYSAPSLSINQEKHLYSNFDNGAAIGIFTFRARCSVMKEMDNSFKTQFKSNQSTCPYKFFNAAASGQPGC